MLRIPTILFSDMGVPPFTPAEKTCAAEGVVTNMSARPLAQVRIIRVNEEFSALRPSAMRLQEHEAPLSEW